MGLTIEDEELLKRWLKGEITSQSDTADPIHLSDYVVSIIKQSNNNNYKTIEQIKSFYIEQLNVFLKDKTIRFVNNLIQVLEDNSYIVDFDEDDENQNDEYDNDENYNDESDNDNDDRRFNKNDNDNEERKKIEDSCKRQKINEKEHYKKSPDGNRYNNYHDYHHKERGIDRRQSYNNYDREKRNFNNDNLMFQNSPYIFPNMYGQMGTMNMMGMMGHSGYPIFNPMMNTHGYSAFLDKPKPPNGPPPTTILDLNQSINQEENIQNFKSLNNSDNHHVNCFQQINKNQQRSNKWGDSFVQKLPEDECCTLKCNGIPSKVTIDELKKHFKTFGRIIEIQIKEALIDKNDPEKKVYNECLVQFASAIDAKKCLNSPTAVLNNRFIKLHQSNFNILPLADISPLTAQEQYEDEIEREKFIREKKGILSKNYKRLNDNESTIEREYKTVMKSKLSTVPKVLVAKQKAEAAVLNQYDDLRKLREQAELILKKKEQILQTQIENYRVLMNKAQQTGDGDIWEAKIMDLQQQLNSLRNERETGRKPSNIQSTGRPPVYGGRARIPYRARGGRRSYRGGKIFNGGRLGREEKSSEIIESETNEVEEESSNQITDEYLNGFDDYYEETTITNNNGKDSNSEDVKSHDELIVE